MWYGYRVIPGGQLSVACPEPAEVPEYGVFDYITASGHELAPLALDAVAAAYPRWSVGTIK